MIETRCPKCRALIIVEENDGVFAGAEVATCPSCNIQFPAVWPPKIECVWYEKLTIDKEDSPSYNV